MRESFKILAENLDEFISIAKSGCFGDSCWVEDAMQQLWVEAAFLEDRHARTKSTIGLKTYMFRHMWDRIRIFYEKASNVVEPPEHIRVIRIRDAYSQHTKDAAELSLKSKFYKDVSEE